jgi:hypothetical protein
MENQAAVSGSGRRSRQHTLDGEQSVRDAVYRSGSTDLPETAHLGTAGHRLGQFDCRARYFDLNGLAFLFILLWSYYKQCEVVCSLTSPDDACQ